MCGFRSNKDVPRADVYSRFLKNLLNNKKLIDAIFNQLVDELETLLPDFGKDLAIDGKALSSVATGYNKNKKTDGRRDLDANWGIKEYKGTRENGTLWTKTVKWFGYNLHLIVDANYELPIAYELTTASKSESKQAHKMIDTLAQKQHPDIIKRCETLAADKGYDDTKLHVKLWDKYGIKALIDIRNMWKNKEPRRLHPSASGLRKCSIQLQRQRLLCMHGNRHTSRDVRRRL